MADLRIGFAGASGTGKTWLATRIAEELGLPLCPIGSRQVAAQLGYASPYDVDKVPGARRAFQVELLRQKVAWERGHASFVSDRTPVDNLTYTALHDVGAIDEAMLALTREHFATYTHVIVCYRSGFSQLGDDPSRVLNESYQTVYEACLLGLIDDLIAPRRNTAMLPLGLRDSDDRLSWVRGFIQENKRD